MVHGASVRMIGMWHFHVVVIIKWDANNTISAKQYLSCIGSKIITYILCLYWKYIAGMYLYFDMNIIKIASV